MQKRRAWRQFTGGAGLYEICRGLLRASGAETELAAAYRSLASRWDRTPLLEMNAGALPVVERQVNAGLCLIAAAASVAWARDFGGNHDALIVWASRAARLRDIPSLSDTDSISAADNAAGRLRAVYRLLAGREAPARAEVGQAMDAALELGASDEPGRRVIHSVRAPVLLAHPPRGHIAWFWIQRVAGGLGVCYRSGSTLMDPLTPACVDAVTRACVLAQLEQPIPRDEDVRWWISDLPRDGAGRIVAIDGASLQAVAAIAFILSLRGSTLDPHTAIAAALDEGGGLLPVGGLSNSGPKLEAALALAGPGRPARVITHSRSLPQPAERASWALRGVELVECATLQEALHLSRDAPTLPESKPPAPAPAASVPPAAPVSAPVEGVVGSVAVVHATQDLSDSGRARELEAALEKRGYRLRHAPDLPISTEWARQVSEQIRSADLVLVLASRAGAASEMVMHQVGVARSETRGTGGPRLVGILCEEIESTPLFQLLSTGATLNWPEGGVEPLVEQLSAGRGWMSDEERRALAPPTGVLPLDSPVYITRECDQILRQSIRRSDSLIRIRGARQMGKTSLLARGLDEARQHGMRVVLTDLQVLNNSHFEDADTFLRSLARWIGRQLPHRPAPEEIWDPLNGPNANFRDFMLESVLGELAEPLVWALDEVDRLFPTPFGAEVFGVLRAWHNERALDPSLPWRNLSIVLSYATEAQLFIADLNQSPFNVGTRIPMGDFTLSEVQELNRAYASPAGSGEDIDRLYTLLGGHPYLTNRALHELAVRRMHLPVLLAEMQHENGLFGDHLRRLLTVLAQAPESEAAVREVLRSGRCPSRELFQRLWSGGVLAGNDQSDCRLRCVLYEEYLRRHLG